MRLVIKNSVQLCLRTLVFSIVLGHSNYNNRIISIEGTFLGTPCIIVFTSMQCLQNFVENAYCKVYIFY
jgi:hypothetical protein